MLRRAEKEAFWRLVLEEYSRSGLTVREFCRNEGLSEPSFYSWRKKVSQRDGQRPALAEWVPVRVVPNPVLESAGAVSAGPSHKCEPSLACGDGGQRGLEIATPGGLRVRVGEACSVELIHRTLVAIQKSASEFSRC